jgi:hypothetical protein
MVTSMMVEDQMRGLAGRPLEEFLHNLKTPSDSFVTFIKDQAIASLVAIYYTLQVFILLLINKIFSRHDITEILLKLALNTNQSILLLTDLKKKSSVSKLIYFVYI